MVTMTMNNQLYIAEKSSAVDGYFTVIGDFLSKIQHEIKLHRDISDICRSFDSVISVCEVAQYKLEQTVEKSSHFQVPMPFWLFIEKAEELLPRAFEKIISLLEKEETSWLTYNKQVDAVNKAKQAQNALLKLIQRVQTFNTADSWDLEVAQKFVNKTIYPELEANPIQVSTEDWMYILHAIAEDKIKPSVPDEAKKAAKNYRAILSS